MIAFGAWIVVGIQIFKTQWTDRRNLGDVVTGFCPMKVRRVTRENNDAAGRIGLQVVAVELIAEANVENTGDDRVDTVLRVPVRHQLYAAGDFHPYHIGRSLRGLPDHDGKPDR